jgi:CHASE2 domain-containing sensor protein
VGDERSLNYYLSDRTLDKVLNNLAQHEPRAIGLDIYRDLPVEPGHIELEANLQLNTDLVPICNARDNIAPPPSVPNSRLGFSDVVLDGDRIVRRHLLFITPNPESKCLANYSLGMLAIQALTGSLPTDIVKDEVRKVVMWREVINVEVSDTLAGILDRMVRYEASDRYQSATDVLQALQDLE